MPVIGRFSRTKSAGKIVSKCALDVGKLRQEVNMAEVVEVEHVKTQDWDSISKNLSEAQRKDECKELEKHPYLWEIYGADYKNKQRRTRTWMSYVKNLTFHQTVSKKKKNYSRLPVTRTLYNSNLPLTRSNFYFPSDHFLYNFTLDNSNSRKLELFSISLEGSNYRESTVHVQVQVY